MSQCRIETQRSEPGDLLPPASPGARSAIAPGSSGPTVSLLRRGHMLPRDASVPLRCVLHRPVAVLGARSRASAPSCDHPSRSAKAMRVS